MPIHWQNLTDSKWVVDNDQFSVNQFLHPYSGSIYYGLARSPGLNFWESFGFWRELGAAVISPPTGFNRLVFGNRFDAVFPSYQPATFLRLMAGGTLTSIGHNVSSSVAEHGAVGDFTFTYGLPGKPGYTYKRPFDYFDFHVTAATANTLESINSRGLLLGATYASRDTTRGILGFFGSYDYISPQVFRVSSVALSLGTVWQSWLSHTIALQGTALGGAGYGAAGSIQRTEDRDYHYGATSQGLLASRLIFGKRAMIDLTGARVLCQSDACFRTRGRKHSGWRRLLHSPGLRPTWSRAPICGLASGCPLPQRCIQQSAGCHRQPDVRIARTLRIRRRRVALNELQPVRPREPTPLPLLFAGDGEVLNDDGRITERIGREGSGVPMGHGGAQPLRRLADGKGERRVLLNPTEVLQRIPTPERFRKTRQPRFSGESHGSSRTDPRLAFVAVLPRNLGRREFPLNESSVDHATGSFRWLILIRHDSARLLRNVAFSVHVFFGSATHPSICHM